MGAAAGQRRDVILRPSFQMNSPVNYLHIGKIGLTAEHNSDIGNFTIG